PSPRPARMIALTLPLPFAGVNSSTLAIRPTTRDGFRKNWGGVRSWRPVGPAGRGRVWGGPSPGAPMLTRYLAGVFGASMRSHAAHPPAGEPSGRVAGGSRPSAAKISAKYPVNIGPP